MVAPSHHLFFFPFRTDCGSRRERDVSGKWANDGVKVFEWSEGEKSATQAH